MAFHNGEVEDWVLHERTSAEHEKELYNTLVQGFIGGRKVVGFGVAARSGETSDFAMVFLRMKDVLWWEIDGILDEEFFASVWQPDA